MQSDSDSDMEREKNPEEWKQEGNAHYKKGEYELAISAYSVAIEMSDGEVFAFYNNRAAAYLMCKKFKECVADCVKSIAIDSTAANAKAFFRKASAFKAMGKLQEAVDGIKEGLKVDPDNTAGNTDLQNLESGMVQLEELKKVLDTPNLTVGQSRVALQGCEALAKKLGAGVGHLPLIRASAMLGLGRTEEAYNLSNQLMRSGAQNIDQLQLLVLRAKCLSSMGDVENSVKHLQQALRSDPDNSSCRTQYKKMKEIHETKTEGDTHFRAGEHDEAIAAWTKAVNLMTTGIPGFSTSKIYITKIYTNRAVAWSKKGDLQKAISDCSLGIKEDPSSIKCHYRRAEFNFTLGETKEQLNQSIRDYEKVDQLQSADGTLEDSDKINIKSKLQAAHTALKRVGKKDLYKVLGISKSADEDGIKKAYRRAALKWHPDKQASKSEKEREEAVVKFKEIGEAYGVLSDGKKRKRYDSGVDVNDLEQPEEHDHMHQHGHGSGGGMGGGGGMPGGITPEMLAAMFGQQSGGGGGGRRGGNPFGGGGKGGGFPF